MAIYKTTDGKIKTIPSGARLIEGTFTDMTGQSAQASVWEKDKEGNLFPNFDQIPSGIEFEGNAWTNPKTGKIALYAPKPPKSASSSFAGKTTYNKASVASQVAKAQETTHEHVKEAQEVRGEGVKTSATFRDATLISLEMYKRDPKMSELDFNKKWLEMRRWLLDHWEITSQDIPF